MGNFSQLAKSLIAEKTPAAPVKDNDIVQELTDAGFSRREVITEYRTLYDSADEIRDKRQILDKVAEMHGLTEPENVKQVPRIIINVGGENNRMAVMLNPSLTSGEVINDGG
jgi:hypothetical protein